MQHWHINEVSGKYIFEYKYLQKTKKFLNIKIYIITLLMNALPGKHSFNFDVTEFDAPNMVLHPSEANPIKIKVIV